MNVFNKLKVAAVKSSSTNSEVSTTFNNIKIVKEPLLTTI